MQLDQGDNLANLGRSSFCRGALFRLVIRREDKGTYSGCFLPTPSTSTFGPDKSHPGEKLCHSSMGLRR